MRCDANFFPDDYVLHVITLLLGVTFVRRRGLSANKKYKHRAIEEALEGEQPSKYTVRTSSSHFPNFLDLLLNHDPLSKQILARLHKLVLSSSRSIPT